MVNSRIIFYLPQDGCIIVTTARDASTLRPHADWQGQSLPSCLFGVLGFPINIAICMYTCVYIYICMHIYVSIRIYIYICIDDSRQHRQGTLVVMGLQG